MNGHECFLTTILNMRRGNPVSPDGEGENILIRLDTDKLKVELFLSNQID